LQEEEARQRAEMDGLTGIRNRHGCELFIDRALRHAREDNLFVGVMLIDLDGFKAVNDTLGHAAGDTVLIEVARRLRDRIRRSTDLVGRLGGDEFVVLIYNCGDDRTLLSQVASDIVTSLAQPVTVAENQSAQIGASIGIACFPHDGLTRETVFSRADEAMYAVKRRGKNAYGFVEPLPVGLSETA
jgi:diguanylate cyclase (GGDEF)-like protein